MISSICWDFHLKSCSAIGGAFPLFVCQTVGLYLRELITKMWVECMEATRDGLDLKASNRGAQFAVSKPKGQGREQ